MAQYRYRVINGEQRNAAERDADLERPALRQMSAHGLEVLHDELASFLKQDQPREHLVTVTGTQLSWRDGVPLHGEYRYALSWLPNSFGLPSREISKGRAYLFVAPESGDFTELKTLPSMLQRIKRAEEKSWKEQRGPLPP